jgi:lipoprotein-releasing system permease protein
MIVAGMVIHNRKPTRSDGPNNPMSFETFIIRRYLKIKHQRRLVPLITILSTLGVAVGVSVLVVVLAVMTGFQAELKARILGIESHIMIMRYNDWISDYDDIIAQIEKHSGVQSAAPYIYAQGMLRSASGVLGIQLKGIDPHRADIRIPVGRDRTLSQLIGATGPGDLEIGIVLGTVLADKLGLGVGDGVMLMVAGVRQSDPRRLPKMHRLRVLGVFDTGMHQYDGNIGFLHIEHLQRLSGITGLATGIEVRVDDVDRVDTIMPPITEALGTHYWATNWKQMHRNLFSMLALQKVVMFVIMTLIIIVAAFNIASALFMMVREKTKEIAILKAMGATDRSLKRIFLSKGIIIGLSGIALGVAGGLAVCWLLTRYQFVELPGDVYFLTTLPVLITWLDLGSIALGTLAVCIFASLYPARQAARMNPVDAIRFG